MFSRIRKRLTYANIVMTLALVFAMTGGAYAANKYLITSTKQINPKVLASLKAKNGKNGTNGTPGPTGPQGPTGPTGPTGATGTKGEAGAAGKEGPQGKEGPEGTEGSEGKEGSPWAAGGTLPSGQTETGTFSITSETGTGVDAKFAVGNISFTIPLSAPLARDHVIYVSQSTPSECENSAHAGSASVENPEASAGYLCVYQGAGLAVNKSEMEIYKPASFSYGADVSGALLLQEVTEAEALSTGTWAVTAP